jgi:hypothetical protein
MLPVTCHLKQKLFSIAISLRLPKHQWHTAELPCGGRAGLGKVVPCSPVAHDYSAAKKGASAIMGFIQGSWLHASNRSWVVCWQRVGDRPCEGFVWHTTIKV